MNEIKFINLALKEMKKVYDGTSDIVINWPIEPFDSTKMCQGRINTRTHVIDIFNNKPHIVAHEVFHYMQLTQINLSSESKIVYHDLRTSWAYMAIVEEAIKSFRTYGRNIQNMPVMDAIYFLVGYCLQCDEIEADLFSYLFSFEGNKTFTSHVLDNKKFILDNLKVMNDNNFYNGSPQCYKVIENRINVIEKFYKNPTVNSLAKVMRTIRDDELYAAYGV